MPVDLLPGKGGAGCGKGVKLKPTGKPSDLYISGIFSLGFGEGHFILNFLGNKTNSLLSVFSECLLLSRIQG